MNKYSLSALAAAGLLAGGLATSANAADLGAGGGLADLEERIAELEATTARKGNRKVSLTISGWVAEEVTWWDDGEEDNVYVGGIGTTLGTNVKFTGQATIVPGWTAGYVIHLEADGSDTLAGTNADTPVGKGLLAGTTNYVQTLQSYWFIKSDHWGKVGVGLQSAPADNAAILVDGSGSLVPANWVAFDVGGFNFTGTADGPPLIRAGGGLPGDFGSNPLNVVRYDTPTFAGFSASAAWGEDDYWDVAVRYAGEHHGFKIAAAVAYLETSGSDSTVPGGWPDGPYAGEGDSFQAGLYLQHIGTGLFGLVNYGFIETDDADDAGFDNEVWYFKGGIRRNWNHLGATVLYGEYLNAQDGVTVGDEYEWWGLGAVQEIDAAAMSLWLKYRQFSYDDDSGEEYNDFDQFTFGALINF